MEKNIPLKASDKRTKYNLNEYKHVSNSIAPIAIRQYRMVIRKINEDKIENWNVHFLVALMRGNQILRQNFIAAKADWQHNHAHKNFNRISHVDGVAVRLNVANRSDRKLQISFVGPGDGDYSKFCRRIHINLSIYIRSDCCGR